MASDHARLNWSQVNWANFTAQSRTIVWVIVFGKVKLGLPLNNNQV